MKKLSKKNCYRGVKLVKKVIFGKAVLFAATAATAMTIVTTNVSADTASDLADVNAKITETTKKVTEGQKKLAELQTQQYEKGKEIEALQKNIASRNKQLKNQARSAQLNNASSMLEFITNSKSITDAIDRTIAVATVVKANNQTLADQKADKQKVAADKKALDQAAQQQEETVKQLQQDVAQLAVHRAELEVKKATEDQAKQAAQEAQRQAQEAAQQAANAKTAQEAEQAANAATDAVNKVSGSTQQAPSASNYANVIDYAKSFIGVPYVWGGTTPAGFDCSGFVQYVYAAFGKSLPRVTTSQENAGTVIPVSQAQPGDLLFWGPKGATYHVAISLGGSSYIHAPQPGESVKIGSTAYYTPSFAVRLN